MQFQSYLSSEWKPVSNFYEKKHFYVTWRSLGQSRYKMAANQNLLQIIGYNFFKLKSLLEKVFDFKINQ